MGVPSIPAMNLHTVFEGEERLGDDLQSLQNCNQVERTLMQVYRDKICVCDMHPIAGRDIQYWAPGSWSEYTTLFDNIK